MKVLESTFMPNYNWGIKIGRSFSNMLFTSVFSWSPVKRCIFIRFYVDYGKDNTVLLMNIIQAEGISAR